MRIPTSATATAIATAIAIATLLLATTAQGTPDPLRKCAITAA